MIIPENNPCGITVRPYMIQDTEKYGTDDWKVIHNVTIYNKQDGDFALIDKHVTLRFKTTSKPSKGSEIFTNITLADIQVNNHKPSVLNIFIFEAFILNKWLRKIYAPYICCLYSFVM